MKILWVSCNFLHPTTKGGHIRSLEMLRQLHQRHEIHYVAFSDPNHPEGPDRAKEYSTRAYAIPHSVPSRRSPSFALQAIRNLFSTMPLPVQRYESRQMRACVHQLRSEHRFDVIVCDFLFPAPNFETLDDVVLFEHNVEATIWRRQAQTAGNRLLRAYFGLQARRMFAYERQVCSQAARVIAVSPIDAASISDLYGISEVRDVPTGVDLDYFSHPPDVPLSSDLVFTGSMDWMPNIDAVVYFVEEIFPLILKRRPNCTLTVAGRRPSVKVQRIAERHPNIRLTGTVADIRPFLWGAAVSIVPLRIGSGTRLKIYESMAARVPVVSTTVGAEGLEVHPPADIRIADHPAEFARECLDLLENESARAAIAASAHHLVDSRFSWDQVSRRMEELLTSRPCAGGS